VKPVTPDPVAAIVFSAAEIAAAVARLAVAISNDYGSEPVLLVGVLKGALFLTADLARALPPGTDARIDFLAVSSYGNAARSSGEVRLLKDVAESVEGKNVVIVEDIVDNGLTLQYLLDLFGRRGPASLRSCVLLDKPYRRVAEVPIDYLGLTAPDAFIVGYGLDYQEKFRNLPYLARLHSWVFEG
jgi:hypoxanthine phosphoribosyltransferase